MTDEDFYELIKCLNINNDRGELMEVKEDGI